MIADRLAFVAGLFLTALREHLLAQVHAPAPPPPPPPLQRTHAFEGVRGSSSPSSPLYAHNVDPAIGGSGMMSHSAGESGGDDNGSDGKKGSKRELSTSKRAAQNRAAQVRLFRLYSHSQFVEIGDPEFHKAFLKVVYAIGVTKPCQLTNI